MTRAQAYDSHPYATYCFFIEEMNKRGIAYVHMVEPRAKGKEGAASPVAEFSNEHTDETLEVRNISWACEFAMRGAGKLLSDRSGASGKSQSRY